MKLTPYDPVTGKHEDLTVHKKRSNGSSIVTLGERRIGEIFGPNKYSGWTAVSHAQPPQLRGLRLVNGFATRRDACEYLLKVGVYDDSC